MVDRSFMVRNIAAPEFLLRVLLQSDLPHRGWLLLISLIILTTFVVPLACAEPATEESIQSIPIFTDNSRPTLHFVNLWCGTPPQRLPVRIDTTSRVTAFPCSECVDCGDNKILFDEGASVSFQRVTCDACSLGRCSTSASGNDECSIGVSYQEGSSWRAFEAADSCFLGGDSIFMNRSQESFNLRFACQTVMTGLFKVTTTGLLGMDNAATSFWSQMYSANIIPRRAFGICFRQYNRTNSAAEESGILTLGGTDQSLHMTDMVYTEPHNGLSTFNSVALRKVYLQEGITGESVGRRLVQLKVNTTTLISHGTFVDSGTTDTYFARVIKTAFENAWLDLVGKPYSHKPQAFTKEELNQLPTILLQMKGNVTSNQDVANAKGGVDKVVGLAGSVDREYPYDVLVALPPSQYFEYDMQSNTYTSRFYIDKSRGNVLGTNTMMNHQVFFDVEQKQIGWARSLCRHYFLPSGYPSLSPTAAPTFLPSSVPSGIPSASPTDFPSTFPSPISSEQPTGSVPPTPTPSGDPSCGPTMFPSIPPSRSQSPTDLPAGHPPRGPSLQPSLVPSHVPCMNPSDFPSVVPSSSQPPTVSLKPSEPPFVQPSVLPTGSSAPSLNPSSLTSPSAIKMSGVLSLLFLQSVFTILQLI